MTDENKVKTKKTEKVSCGFCSKKCSGNVLKVQEKYFHIECFKCQKCKTSLAQDGFFLKDGKYFCSKDYQKLFGTKCSVCKEFVQGEVVTALGKTYHQKCFACAKCSFIFPPGDKVIFLKNECLCSNCAQKYNLEDKKVEDKNLKKKSKKDKNNNITKSLPLNLDKKLGLKKSEKKDDKKENEQKIIFQKKNEKDLLKCAGCGKSFDENEKTKDQLNNRSSSRQSGRSVKIQSDQLESPKKEKSVLYALEKHWHESCFKCNTCQIPLFNKEYMTTTIKSEKEQNDKKSTESLRHQSLAHCMNCYKAKLGVYCVHCKRPIEGKVLQAGEELHFHPSCARCCKCGDRFTHAQEMFVQGKAIWHAQCEGLRYEQLENHHNSPYLRSRSLPRSQPISPYGSLYQIHRTQHISPVSLDHHHKLSSIAANRSYRERGQTLPANLSPLSTVYSYSYLTNNEPNLTYLKKPLQPQNANSPQYHLPGDYPYRSRSNFSRSSSATRSSPNLMSGMRALVETLHPHYRSISPSERSIKKQQNKNRIAVKAKISNSSLKEFDQIDNEIEKNKNFNSNEQVDDQTMDDLSDDNPSDNSLRQQLINTNEEVIELAHYPDARKPFIDEIAPIERDDFPAPPFPLSVSRNSHRSVKSSTSSMGLRNNMRSSSRARQQNTNNNKTMNSNGNTSEDEAEEEKTEEIDLDIDDLSDPLEINRRQNLQDQLRKEEEELRKLGSGIGQVFLNNLKEREKRLREFHLDPRNASRTPSARVELQKRLRYKNPVNASPSRFLDNYKSWEDEELDQFSIYRCSNGRSSNYTAPYNTVSSQRLTPKPGYSLKKDNTNYTLDNNLDKTQSIDFNCGKSDLSANLESDRNYINRSISGTFGLSPYSDLYRASLMRNSMPNVSIHKSNEPPKLYPYHLLIITNYRLPPDVDRCHLEAHLSNEEFEMLFQMARIDFYRLPEWKRNELKKRVKLF